MIILWSVLVLAGLGLIFGFGLAIASKVLHVEVDTRVEDISKMLPNYNCGSCGYPGCNGFAEAIVNGEAEALSQCKPGKLDTNFASIRKYLDEHPNSDGSVNPIKIK